MTLQQIQMCERLAAVGSINAAARGMRLTQPAISTSLAQLEQELNVRLFNRSKTGVQLTRTGKEILPIMKRIILAVSEIESHVSELPHDRGDLSIAGRQGFMQYVFPYLLGALQQQYPRIRIRSVVSGSQSDVIDALTNGRVDIAFASKPSGKSIVAETMFHDPVLICASQRQSLTTLNTEKLQFCLPSKEDRLRRPIERAIRSVVTNPIISLESDDYTMLGKLIASGTYVGPIYGHMLLDDEIRKSVVPIDNFDARLNRDLTLLYRRDDLRPHAVTAKAVFISETQRVMNIAVKSLRGYQIS